MLTMEPSLLRRLYSTVVDAELELMKTDRLREGVHEVELALLGAGKQTLFNFLEIAWEAHEVGQVKVRNIDLRGNQ